MNIGGSYPSRAQAKKIFERVDPASDPEGLISNFVTYELARLTRSRTEFNPTGNLADRLKVLAWYINAYAYHRRGTERVPLSGAQIRYLNSPMPLVGVDPSVTIGFFHFVTTDLSRGLDFNDLPTLRHHLYWWCMEKLPPLNLEDRLITKEQADVLAADVLNDGQKYPLNIFAQRYLAEHPSLDWVDLNNPRDRVALYYYLVLQSFSTPHIARFIPKDIWRQAVNVPFKTEGQPFLELLLQKHAQGSASSVAPKELIRQGERILNAYGFSTKLGWTPITDDEGNTGLCMQDRWGLDGAVQDGVNVIGPIQSTSGLGQATRLTLDVMKAVEPVPPLTTLFGLDNPAPIGFASTVKVEWPHEKRAINLIHLNAESAPLAFAYLPKTLYEQSYNIGYFFWELDKLPECHLLALDMLDEVWVSSEYNREVYEKYASIPVTNVGMAVEPVPEVAPFDRRRLGFEESAFVFLMIFDSFSFVERKNPLGVINAFREAFPLGTENVRLLIKTQNRTRVRDPYQMRVWDKIDKATEADPRISVLDETFKYADLLGLKLACDCYVSLHRSEGWGFGMIEAMQLGRPVICTAYSGNAEFCTEETAFLVDYELTAPLEEEYIFVPRGSQWADPIQSSAVARMREVSQNPDLGKAKGEAAQKFIAEHFSVGAIGSRYAGRLREIRAILASQDDHQSIPLRG